MPAQEGAADEVGGQRQDFRAVLPQGVAVGVDLEAAHVAVDLLRPLGEPVRQVRVGALVVGAVDEQHPAARELAYGVGGEQGVRLGQPGGEGEHRRDGLVAGGAQRGARAQARTDEADRYVPVAPHRLVRRPFGVPHRVGGRAVPAAVAVAEDVDGQALGLARPGEPAGQRALGGQGAEGGPALPGGGAVGQQQGDGVHGVARPAGAQGFAEAGRGRGGRGGRGAVRVSWVSLRQRLLDHGRQRWQKDGWCPPCLWVTVPYRSPTSTRVGARVRK